MFLLYVAKHNSWRINIYVLYSYILYTCILYIHIIYTCAHTICILKVNSGNNPMILPPTLFASTSFYPIWVNGTTAHPAAQNLDLTLWKTMDILSSHAWSTGTTGLVPRNEAERIDGARPQRALSAILGSLRSILKMRL